MSYAEGVSVSYGEGVSVRGLVCMAHYMSHAEEGLAERVVGGIERVCRVERVCHRLQLYLSDTEEGHDDDELGPGAPLVLL